MFFSDYHQPSYSYDNADGHKLRTVRSVDSEPFASQQLEFFQWASNIISTTAGIDGKACVQRLICELSEVPLKDKSFMGYVLHTIIE